MFVVSLPKPHTERAAGMKKEALRDKHAWGNKEHDDYGTPWPQKVRIFELLKPEPVNA